MTASCLLPAAHAATPPEKAVGVEPVHNTGRSVRLALVVGINEYQHHPHLRYCVDDAALLADTLRRHCLYDVQNVLLLTDGAKPLKDQPTKASILQAASQLAELAEPNDTVLFFLSGHGVLLDGRAYFVPVEADQAFQEMVSIAELRRILRKSKAQRRVLILDACHSGGEKSSETAKMSQSFEDDLRADSEGIVTLASCRAEETSLEAPSKGHGLFTYWLIQGLKGEADTTGDRNHRIDILELYRFVSDRVKQEAMAEFRHLQRPTLIAAISGQIELAVVDQSSAKPAPDRTADRPADGKLIVAPDRLTAVVHAPLKSASTADMLEAKQQLRIKAQSILKAALEERGFTDPLPTLRHWNESVKTLDAETVQGTYSVTLGKP